MRMTCRFGVSCAVRNFRARFNPCWMLVKCQGTIISLISGLLISKIRFTSQSDSVTGLYINAGISATFRGLANVYISMNCRKSPGYSV